MDFTHIGPGVRYMSTALISTISTLVCDLGDKYTDLEYSCKTQYFAFYDCSYVDKTLLRIVFMFNMMVVRDGPENCFYHQCIYLRELYRHPAYKYF